MNRRIGIILALAGAIVIGGCAAAATNGPPADRWTRDAERELALAMLREDPVERAPHFEEALRIAEEGLEERPENANLWLIKGQAHAGLGDFPDADRALSRAQELHPPFAEEIVIEREHAWVDAYNVAAEALREDRVEDAIEAFEHADMMYPARPDARVILGWLYEREGETELAIESYQRALEVLRGPPPEGMVEEQVQEWEENLQASTFQLARLLSAAGRHEQAVAVYEEFLEQQPGHIEGRLNLALALGQAGRSAEANQMLAEVLREDLTETQLFLVGVGLFQAEEYERAIEAFEGVLARNPFSRDAAYNLAQARFVQAGALETELEAATGAEARRIRTELVGRYQGMYDAAVKAFELDPYNRNILLLKVSASRGLMEQVGADADRQRFQQQTVELLQSYENLDFDLLDVAITSQPGGISVIGSLENLLMSAGAPINLRFTFYGPGGTQLGAESVTIQAPAPEQRASFEFAAPIEDDVTGWRYERVD